MIRAVVGSESSATCSSVGKAGRTAKTWENKMKIMQALQKTHMSPSGKLHHNLKNSLQQTVCLEVH